MKAFLIFASVAAALILAANGKAMRDARAIEAAAPVVTPTPSPVPTAQVVFFDVVATPTPRPVYRVSESIPEYELNARDVDRIAQLLWSSPLRSESEKAKLVWLCLNRVDAGFPFGSCISEVVNDTEFSFFDRHAKISDKNRRIVRGVMQRWLAEKDGYGIGRRPPKNALYVRFCGEYNRKVALTAEKGGKTIDW